MTIRKFYSENIGMRLKKYPCTCEQQVPMITQVCMPVVMWLWVHGATSPLMLYYTKLWPHNNIIMPTAQYIATSYVPICKLTYHVPPTGIQLQTALYRPCGYAWCAHAPLVQLRYNFSLKWYSPRISCHGYTLLGYHVMANLLGYHIMILAIHPIIL